MEEDVKEKKSSSKTNFPIFGVILICLGILIFLGAYFGVLNIKVLWPLFMLIPVFSMCVSLFKDPKKNAGTLIPLTILVFLTVYFLWLNFVGWHMVSRTWPNFMLAPGLGCIAVFLVDRECRGLLITGSILIIVSIASYVALIANVNRLIILGVALILAGLFIMFSHKKMK